MKRLMKMSVMSEMLVLELGMLMAREVRESMTSRLMPLFLMRSAMSLSVSSVI